MLMSYQEETPLPLAVQTQLFHTAKKDVYTENYSKALPQGRRAPLTNPKVRINLCISAEFVKKVLGAVLSVQTPHLRSHARAQARKENLPSIAGAQQKPFRLVIAYHSIESLNALSSYVNAQLFEQFAGRMRYRTKIGLEI